MQVRTRARDQPLALHVDQRLRDLEPGRSPEQRLHRLRLELASSASSPRARRWPGPRRASWRGRRRRRRATGRTRRRRRAGACSSTFFSVMAKLAVLPASSLPGSRPGNATGMVFDSPAAMPPSRRPRIPGSMRPSPRTNAKSVALAAGELHAVDGADEVDGHAVAARAPAAGPARIECAACAGPRSSCRLRRRRPSSAGRSIADARQVAGVDLGIDLEGRAELQLAVGRRRPCARCAGSRQPAGSGRCTASENDFCTASPITSERTCGP